jgi:hypothetical protein
VSIIWEGIKAQPPFSLLWPALGGILHCGMFLRSRLSRSAGPRCVSIVGVDTDCSLAWLSIIPFPFPMCQALMAKRQSLSKHSCHKTRFMLLSTHSDAECSRTVTIHVRGVGRYDRRLLSLCLHEFPESKACSLISSRC